MTQICPKCKGTKFVLQNIDIDNCNYPFVSIQCKTCGNSMGVRGKNKWFRKTD